MSVLKISELIEQLQEFNPNTAIRIRVTHDLDCELVNQGVILDIDHIKKGGGLGVVVLDCSDDGHGHPKVA
jgi:hypothetical protein